MKTKVVLLIIAVLIFFPGASPWEGAAAVAPSGELPASGFFIATNSFPRNTVVDVTNIESGKSTRAIVANTLNSPGLLAIVSREAAELIEMRPGSVSRVRIVQPSDPIAYLRFTESNIRETPIYDSGNVINEETLITEVYRNDTYVPQTVPVTEPVVVTEPAENRVTGPSYLMEPEWGGTERLSIVDLPGYDVNHRENIIADNFIAEQPTQIAEETPRVNNNTQVVTNEEHSVYYTDRYDELIKDVSPRYEERAPNEIVKDIPEYREEVYLVGVDKEAQDFFNEQPRNEVIKAPSIFIAEQPRSEVIKDIYEREEYVAQVQEPVRIVEEQITEEIVEYFVEHIEEQYVYNLVQTEEQPPPQMIYGIDPADIIPGIAIATPENRNVPQQNTAPTMTFIPPVNDQNFSVKTISQLDRGQYYVQIAALPAETVENAVRQIDQRFNPVIFKDGTNLYRVLIGPLNQGESAAVLARFKSIGYKDAFVRRGG